MAFLGSIKNHLTNIPGWRTKRKLVVFESDDWGSIRMPSKSIFNKLLSSGIRVDLCPYNRFDNLESDQDYQALFEVLRNFKDFNGNHPTFTLNFNTANPDFDKIRSSNFESYYYTPFTQTISNYYPNVSVYSYLEQGIKQGLVYPQFHHREHINAPLWLELLQRNTRSLRIAFDNQVYGLSYVTSPDIKLPYLAALLYRNGEEESFVNEAILSGGELFAKIFGYKSQSIIAPLNTWSDSQEYYFKQASIKYIQGGNVHKWYDFIQNSFQKKHHSLGKKNTESLIYLNRNCLFEPSIFGNRYSLEKAIKEIENAFMWGKPAVICTHRLNFMGGINELNRKENLVHLQALIELILKKWPEVEFINSSQLGDLISKPR